MKFRNIRSLWVRGALAVSILPALAGCDDDLNQDWVAVPDTVQLYSLSRPELIGQPSAFDFFNALGAGVSGIPVIVEDPGASGRWDVAVTDVSGGLALAPAGAFVGLTSRAGIATVTGSTLEEFGRAPSDTSRYSSAAVPLEAGKLYVVRSRRESCGFSSGSKYAKLEVLETNPTTGTVRFRAITNPYCNDRRLIPPE